ncbi:hypothetical protein PRVXH_000727 [Proteinivorax hydrogeniformans]|uniref:Uncharacterized protein n=1 Tax=Proteinivorax hydrogeniformans TaxID=1826727 RepID=A0AAU8HVH9_9FIRM
MKKILVLFTAFLLVFAYAVPAHGQNLACPSCVINNEQQPEVEQEEDTEETLEIFGFDIEDIDEEKMQKIFDKIDEKVAKGKITEEQAEELKEKIRQHVEKSQDG